MIFFRCVCRVACLFSFGKNQRTRRQNEDDTQKADTSYSQYICLSVSIVKIVDVFMDFVRDHNFIYISLSLFLCPLDAHRSR